MTMCYLVTISEAVVINVWKQSTSRSSVTSIQTARTTAQHSI